MAYKPVTYISKILWRFFGSGSPDNWEKGLDDIQYIFQEGKITLKPYLGKHGNENFHTRQVVYEDKNPKPTNMLLQKEGALPDEESLIYAREPKAVCFCDIPLNHLSLHMKKYNYIGIGIDRDFLAHRSDDLQPVRYHFIRNENEFHESKDEIYESKTEGGNTIITVNRYVKIPTLFKGDTSVTYKALPDDKLDSSEDFNSIYEEREWRLFNEVTIDYEDISFLLLPSRDILSRDLKNLAKLFEKKVGVIYADQLFHEEDHEEK